MRRTIAAALAIIGFAAFAASASACTFSKQTVQTDSKTTVADTGGQTPMPKSGS